MLRRGERAPTHHARDHNTVKTGRVQGEQLVLEFPKPINLAAGWLTRGAKGSQAGAGCRIVSTSMRAGTLGTNGVHTVVGVRALGSNP
jgi:hypothetical protein